MARTTARSWLMKMIGKIVGPLQIAQKIDDLLLHLPVQRGCGFVQHQHLWLQYDGPRNGDALALAAGEFVRVAVAEGGIELHFRECLGRTLIALLAADRGFMHQEAFGYNLARCHPGAQ